MARKTVYVSDLTGKEIEEGAGVKVTLSYEDARRGVYVLDAHRDDDEVRKLVAQGTKQARRGRKPKAASSD